MKAFFVTLFIIMTALTSNAQTGKAKTTKRTFSRTTSIQTNINASPETVWAILTNADKYPEWNRTIFSIDGQIKKGEKIRLKSTLDPKRTFKLKVKEYVKNEKLVWGDAMGKRTYTITKNEEGVLFSMSEKIGGPMFPLFAGKIPSFDESFDNFAADLKKAAESK